MKKSSQGFSIIELLLVLTIVSVFLGAVFIGYRTINANVNEQKYGDKAQSFVIGLKDYYNTLGAYPQISCTDQNSWNNSPTGTCDWNSHQPSNPANCCALQHFIGPWVTTWSYVATPTSFTINTEPIPQEYIQAVANDMNTLGLTCTTLNGTSGEYLSCSANGIYTNTTAVNE
jgi:prepilin-type N-terminal cleavage/methylation domain-containing protein